MDRVRPCEVDLVKEIAVPRDALAEQRYVVHVFIDSDPVPVPTAVAEDETVEDAEAVRLRAALRLHVHCRHELADRERVRAFAVCQHPRMCRRRENAPPELRDIP